MMNVFRRSLKALVSFALVVLFICASQYAAGNWRLGAIVLSKTAVATGPTCDAGTQRFAIPIVLTRNLNDNFSVWDNASWWDNRTFASTTAYHNFTLRMDYLGSTYRDFHNVTTNGMASGTHTLNVTATVTQLRQYAYFNWTAAVFVTGRFSCSQFSQSNASFLVG